MLKVKIDAEEIGYLQEYFENAYPQEVLRWAWDTFGRNLTTVTSFQPTGIVTLHMLHEIGAHVPVTTLDTGLLFPETYALIDEVEALFDLDLRRITPELDLEQQAAEYGDKLWERNPDRCCHIRKTKPLAQALTGFDAWVTGVRRDQSSTRAHVPVISYDSRNDMVKLCPFASWTESMIWTYLHAHELPYNDLHDRGYPSIGCHTCTRAVVDNDLRSGRWANQSKTECGIHVSLIHDTASGISTA